MRLYRWPKSVAAWGGADSVYAWTLEASVLGHFCMLEQFEELENKGVPFISFSIVASARVKKNT